MNILRFKDEIGRDWVRISKVQARKLYDRGESVCICPCKLKPFTPWRKGFITDENSMEKEGFDELVNAIEFYNCIPETGKYVSFYKMEV